MSRSRFSLLAAIALCSAANAGPSAASNPAGDWPATDHSASAAGFSVVQIASTHGRDFVRDWNRPGPHGEVHGETTVHLGQPLDTFIAFRGCRADPAGRCNVTATFEITGPDGKPQTSPPMDVWANQAQPSPGMIHLSRASLGLSFAPSERPGPYRVRAKVTDHVAGVTLRTQQVITLAK